MDIKKVQEEVIKGIETAQELYERWSESMWLYEGPEYLITVEIARGLMNAGLPALTMEYSVLNALEDAGISGPGQIPDVLRKDGRFDLLLWKEDEDQNDFPFCCIEVKRQGSIATMEDNLDRIMAVLTRKVDDNTFEFGIFAFFFRVYPRVKIEVALKPLIEAAQEWLLDGLSFTVKKGEVRSHPEYGDWMPVCFCYERA